MSDRSDRTRVRSTFFDPGVPQQRDLTDFTEAVLDKEFTTDINRRVPPEDKARGTPIDYLKDNNVVNEESESDKPDSNREDIDDGDKKDDEGNVNEEEEGNDNQGEEENSGLEEYSRDKTNGKRHQTDKKGLDELAGTGDTRLGALDFAELVPPTNESDPQSREKIDADQTKGKVSSLRTKKDPAESVQKKPTVGHNSSTREQKVVRFSKSETDQEPSGTDQEKDESREKSESQSKEEKSNEEETLRSEHNTKIDASKPKTDAPIEPEEETSEDDTDKQRVGKKISSTRVTPVRQDNVKRDIGIERNDSILSDSSETEEEPRDTNPDRFKAQVEKIKMILPNLPAYYPSFESEEYCQRLLTTMIMDQSHQLNTLLVDSMNRAPDKDCLNQLLHVALSMRRISTLPLIFRRIMPNLSAETLKSMSPLFMNQFVPPQLMYEYLHKLAIDVKQKRSLLLTALSTMPNEQFIGSINYWIAKDLKFPDGAFSNDKQILLSFLSKLDDGRQLTGSIPLSIATVSALIGAAQLMNPSRAAIQPANVKLLLHAVDDMKEALLLGYSNIFDLSFLHNKNQALAFIKSHGLSLLQNPNLPLSSFLAILYHLTSAPPATLYDHPAITVEAKFAILLQKTLKKTGKFSNVCSAQGTFDIASLLPESKYQLMTATAQAIFLSHIIHWVFNIHPDLQVRPHGIYRSNKEVEMILYEYCRGKPGIEVVNLSPDLKNLDD